MCAPGLERVVVSELAALGLAARRPGQGVVPVQMSTRELYLATASLRSAARVLVSAARFRAATFAELERGAAEVPWGDWLRPGQPVRWRVTSHRAPLFHTGAVAERLAAVVGSGPAEPGATDVQSVVVRIVGADAVVRVDAAGAPLHQRGWRLRPAQAPLRETLAAAALLASGWRTDEPLVDPFCGSGTIAIEAALMARRAAPGLQRGFAFQGWPSFAPGTWASVREALRGALRVDGPSPTIVATDRDRAAIDATRANAERAGVAGDIEVRRSSLSALVDPAPGRTGWLLTNPPWGGRLGGAGDLRDLYAALGTVAGTRLPGWGVALIAADPRLAGHTHLGLEPRLRTRSGGALVHLLVREAVGRSGG
ncbi:MAG: class I SAM-dependent RNA methyltransferase [Actinobacteria bacterium]|nr:class I SAM-dependent RNA methyltransferase [Actinomycetota bacterium]